MDFEQQKFAEPDVVHPKKVIGESLAATDVLQITAVAFELPPRHGVGR
jgi:hypothetical protein